MKAYKAILKDIEKTRKAIEDATAEISRLDYTNERREAAQNGGYFNNISYKELHKAAEANADEIAKLSEEIYKNEVKTRILRANARAALIAEAVPVILKACQPYAGKPYGEKTRDKIREEVKKAGYSFYFEGYKNSRMVVYTLTADGYKSHADEATAAAYDEAGHIQSFLTDDNRLNIQNVIIKPHSDKYAENPAKEAAKVAKMIRAYSEATKALEAQRRELCAILPDRIPEPEYIHEYNVIF